MEINRQLQIAPLLTRESFFLFGPRQTGKSTLLRTFLGPSDLTVNLGIQVRAGSRWTLGAAYREGARFRLTGVETADDRRGPPFLRPLPAAEFRGRRASLI